MLRIDNVQLAGGSSWYRLQYELVIAISIVLVRGGGAAQQSTARGC